eukprot:693944-Alexandrium_andersonii.AAC.1
MTQPNSSSWLCPNWDKGKRATNALQRSGGTPGEQGNHPHGKGQTRQGQEAADPMPAAQPTGKSVRHHKARSQGASRRSTTRSGKQPTTR